MFRQLARHVHFVGRQPRVRHVASYSVPSASTTATTPSNASNDHSYVRKASSNKTIGANTVTIRQHTLNGSNMASLSTHFNRKHSLAMNLQMYHTSSLTNLESNDSRMAMKKEEEEEEEEEELVVDVDMNRVPNNLTVNTSDTEVTKKISPTINDGEISTTLSTEGEKKDVSQEEIAAAWRKEWKLEISGEAETPDGELKGKYHPPLPWYDFNKDVKFTKRTKALLLSQGKNLFIVALFFYVYLLYNLTRVSILLLKPLVNILVN